MADEDRGVGKIPVWATAVFEELREPTEPGKKLVQDLERGVRARPFGDFRHLAGRRHRLGRCNHHGKVNNGAAHGTYCTAPGFLGGLPGRFQCLLRLGSSSRTCHLIPREMSARPSPVVDGDPATLSRLRE